MLYQDIPANTSSYMIAGYMVIFGSMVVYTLSLVLRYRHKRNEIERLRSQD